MQCTRWAAMVRILSGTKDFLCNYSFFLFFLTIGWRFPSAAIVHSATGMLAVQTGQGIEDRLSKAPEFLLGTGQPALGCLLWGTLLYWTVPQVCLKTSAAQSSRYRCFQVSMCSQNHRKAVLHLAKSDVACPFSSTGACGIWFQCVTCWHHGHTGDLCGKLVSVKYLCFALLFGLAGQLAVFSGERLGEEVFGTFWGSWLQGATQSQGYLYYCFWLLLAFHDNYFCFTNNTPKMIPGGCGSRTKPSLAPKHKLLVALSMTPAQVHHMWYRGAHPLPLPKPEGFPPGSRHSPSWRGIRLLVFRCSERAVPQVPWGWEPNLALPARWGRRLGPCCQL